ncbi:putative clathrin assembly protein At1g25240 [Cornus florida]|uniref:putative clathrin assembly protein At1g25240 n=1 Tax=Cornus florida TaxID=4283 RepID=UPI00289E9140|nr:putative clathrin assembly protein At1g25240 [Cornus florida]
MKMKLWKRASGAIKDRNSIWTANLKRRTALHNPNMEVAVIKATSHDDSLIDYRNAWRVFAWIRVSPAYLSPFLRALYMRMDKTRSWVVALKGLVLMHGVFFCGVPTVNNIGHLPFDLSNFKDGHLNPVEASGYNALVRAYYEFLDKKSVFLSMDLQEGPEESGEETGEQLPPVQEIARLQKLQGLLDMLLCIKPRVLKPTNTSLIHEAIDCIIIEIFDIYSRICNGIARVVLRICSARKAEATMAVTVLKKATVQGEELSLYLEFCRESGVLNASQCAKVKQVQEEDIRELELIINSNLVKKEDTDDAGKDSVTAFDTIITDKWELFDEDLVKVNGETCSFNIGKTTATKEDPSADSSTLPLIHLDANNEGSPDLISFL